MLPRNEPAWVLLEQTINYDIVKRVKQRGQLRQHREDVIPGICNHDVESCLRYCGAGGAALGDFK